jgi:hypothetical protein
MNRSVKFYLLGLFAVTAGLLQAQNVPNFTLTNVLNGQKVSLETYPSCQGLLIIFTSNACPFDEYYRARITKLSRDYQDRVPVLLVNSYVEANESVDLMTKKAQQSGLTIPYLADKDQTLMTSLGVSKSPSAYLLKNNGGKFSIVYKGAIDDNAQVEADVHHHHLKDAIDIMLTNQTIETGEVRPSGCTIRKK